MLPPSDIHAIPSDARAPLRDYLHGIWPLSPTQILGFSLLLAACLRLLTPAITDPSFLEPRSTELLRGTTAPHPRPAPGVQ